MKTGDLIRTTRGEAQINKIKGTLASVITSNVISGENTGVIDLNLTYYNKYVFIEWGCEAFNEFNKEVNDAK